MKVIGAGLPRTGTLSTRAALGLLLGPCYHGAVPLVERPEHRQFWIEVMEQESLDEEKAKILLSEYEAGVDIPFMGQYKELLSLYPDAKVLLTVRDARSWYKSAKFIFHVMEIINCHRPYSSFMTMVGLGDMSNFVQRCFVGGIRNGRGQLPTGLQGRLNRALSLGENEAVEFFNKHIEEVKLEVPEERLLIFNVREGWEPLCKFLDVPVPDEPFPNINDASEVRYIFNCIQLVAWMTIIGVPAIIVYGVCFQPTTFVPIILASIIGILLSAGWAVSKIIKNHTQKAKRD